ALERGRADHGLRDAGIPERGEDALTADLRTFAGPGRRHQDEERREGHQGSSQPKDPHVAWPSSAKTHSVVKLFATPLRLDRWFVRSLGSGHGTALAPLVLGIPPPSHRGYGGSHLSGLAGPAGARGPPRQAHSKGGRGPRDRGGRDAGRPPV